ncbi:hypothetical protein KFK09_027103 [Dendrobium nobile]|uniref:Reverse transcriptase zinc-binding domain-containing protein n=1 Tax=Dendrobium nobile TaxID=94219 RepID=A0A8T3A8R7_DENNO|nr:hypothetical protein KFK09_027103 [Dendrobium nobile]
MNAFAHQIIVPWHKFVWHKRYALRFSSYAWLAISESLKIADALSKWGIFILATCVLCNKEMESINHLFFQCDFSFRGLKNFIFWLSPVPFISYGGPEMSHVLPGFVCTRVIQTASEQGFSICIFGSYLCSTGQAFMFYDLSFFMAISAGFWELPLLHRTMMNGINASSWMVDLLFFQTVTAFFATSEIAFCYWQPGSFRCLLLIFGLCSG